MFYISLKFVINLTLTSGVKVGEEPCLQPMLILFAKHRHIRSVKYTYVGLIISTMLYNCILR
jgi:hypothetical protein